MAEKYGEMKTRNRKPHAWQGLGEGPQPLLWKYLFSLALGCAEEGAGTSLTLGMLQHRHLGVEEEDGEEDQAKAHGCSIDLQLGVRRR